MVPSLSPSLPLFAAVDPKSCPVSIRPGRVPCTGSKQQPRLLRPPARTLLGRPRRAERCVGEGGAATRACRRCRACWGGSCGCCCCCCCCGGGGSGGSGGGAFAFVDGCSDGGTPPGPSVTLWCEYFVGGWPGNAAVGAEQSQTRICCAHGAKQ